LDGNKKSPYEKNELEYCDIEKKNSKENKRERRMTRFAIVTTTIYVPKLLEKYAQNSRFYCHDDVCFVVVGDKKTPANVGQYCQDLEQKYGYKIINMDVDGQIEYLKQFPKLGEHLPWNSIQRRNIGSIVAYQGQADVIVTIDDDNLITNQDFLGPKGHGIVGQVTTVPTYDSSTGWLNVCEFLEEEQDIKFYHRGYPIDEKKFRFAPNIDVVIHNSDSVKAKRFAIECKFTEAYSLQRHQGIKPEYIDLNEIWNDIPAIYDLAKSLCPDDEKFFHLHPAQLIKHILGLKKRFGKEGFRLLYLWYDVLGEEGAIHRKEIEAFSEVTRSDCIKFHALSYQELIMKLSNEYRSDHRKYIRYLSDRYL